MDSIAFIDTEIGLNNHKILDLGGIKNDGASFHSGSVSEFISFINGTEFVCGHNIFNHDLKYLQEELIKAGRANLKIIDTLFLSPLLFPSRPYHHLLKDDKLQIEELNNPLNDSIKARDLFYDEISAFKNLDETLKAILFLLLNDKKEFHSFFEYLSFKPIGVVDLPNLISQKFQAEICENAKLEDIIAQHPVELAYCLALINCRNRYSITPPWVLKNYPEVENIMHRLRDTPCISGCSYCNKALDQLKGYNHEVIATALLD